MQKGTNNHSHPFKNNIYMSYRLTHKEEDIMEVLWRLERAFVNDILAELPEPKPPYNTVSSVVRKLAEEGIVGFTAFGKTHQYYPILQKEDYRSNMFQKLMQTYFGGSPKEVLSYFVEEEKINPDELSALLAEIKKRDNKT
jgi:BlaI family transcriptional regulator, penicillinase repressor